MSNIGKIIRVNALPPQGERETNVIYQVAAPGAATYTDYAIDENGDMKTPVADPAAQNLSDDLIKISDPGLVSEGFITQAQFNQNMNEDLDLKLNTPLIDGNAQNFTKVIGLDDHGNTAKLPAGDLGKNVANSSLTTIAGAGLTLGANWTLNTSGLYYSITGLTDASSDTTFNMLLAQNASGRIGKSNGKGAFISLPNQLTESEKTAWKTGMNGGWTTNTMSVAVILPPIVDKQDRDYFITLKGANLNLNPASFSVEIMNSTGTTVIATVPNSQVQLYTNGVDLVFYYNFKNLPLGNYKIRLWNGVAYYITTPTINVIDLLTPIGLSGLSWSMLNNTTICPTVDLTTASGTSIHRARNTNEQFVGTNQDAVSFKSSVLIPSAIADGDFYLELTNMTSGVIYYDGSYGYDYGLVDAAQPFSHSMQILAGIRRNFFFDERILPDNIFVSGSNTNTSVGLNRTSKLYITKKGNIVSISSINNGQLTTVVSTWFQPNGVDLAFFANFNSYNNSNSNNGANIQTDIYINSLIQL
ncbi:hypothetical protein NZD88_13750 [Chryseobacterium antibioticum]|uniref:Uncharacterized protein n=1 Tax=Chryseobacterium pyrolae TaxID=2987481 RepID=A0ABT2IJ23_9FLAO|nr:hypothetical protein [Chryseobacterium pyrolae]MCT2408609.1 hypothetical protein [Chryseobacterium pyrolae]